MYEENKPALAQLIADHGVVRNVKFHRNPDGSMDIAGNLKLWNKALERFTQIPLWENGAPGYDDRDPLQPEPSIVYVPGEPDRGCIIVAHGGGFETRTGCEGFNVAKYFNDKGFPVAVLTYRLKPYTRFDALADMQRAVRLIRCRHEELGCTDKVAVMGFSAGGMLSGNTATNWDLGDPNAADPIERCSCRPDAAVLGYGAFVFLSFPRGFGAPKLGPDAMAEQYKLEVPKRIAPDTPPFFIWQPMSDDGRHGMTTARALQDLGIPYELHIFSSGIHGCAMADGENDLALNDDHVQLWGELCSGWLKQQGL